MKQLDIRINALGELQNDMRIEDLIRFLNASVPDKKLEADQKAAQDERMHG